MSVPDYRIDPTGLAEPGVVLDLAGWYATPLEAAIAGRLSEQLRRAEQRALAGNQAVYAARLGLLIAGFWSGRQVENDHRSLRATATSAQQALADLVYGQLLVSCKRSGAQQLLKLGFAAAAGQLAATDYFAVLKRHELLTHLVLTPTGSPPQALADLLVEAKIIKQLKDKARRGRSFPDTHDDTLG